MKVLFLLLISLTTISIYAQKDCLLSTKDLSDYRIELAEAFASKHSKQQIIVLYYGENEETRKEVYDALCKAKSEGVHIGGMVISSKVDSLDYDSYNYFVGGFKVRDKPQDATVETEVLAYKIAMMSEQIFFGEGGVMNKVVYGDTTKLLTKP